MQPTSLRAEVDPRRYLDDKQEYGSELPAGYALDPDPPTQAYTGKYDDILDPPRSDYRVEIFLMFLIPVVLTAVVVGIAKARVIPKLFAKIRRIRINWTRVVIAGVLAMWFGHGYGLVRYHKEVDFYSRQQVLRYTHAIFGDYHKVSSDDRWDWSVRAGLAAFASIWLLLKAKDNARRE